MGEDDAKEIVRHLKPLIEEQGAKIAGHVEDSTNRKIEAAIEEKLPPAINSTFIKVLDVDPEDRDEIKRLKTSLSNMQKWNTITDEIGGKVTRAVVYGMIVAGAGVVATSDWVKNIWPKH